MNSQYDKTLLKASGEDVFFSANVEVRQPQLVSVGNHTKIDSYLYLTTSAEIGDYVHLATGAMIIGSARGRFVMNHFSTLSIGGRIICGSDEHKGYGLVGPTIPEEFHDRLIIEPVVFGRFANVGASVTILPGVTLGEGSVVGAYSLVNKDTAPWTIYVGVPARPVGNRPSGKMLEYAKQLGYE